ncbi:TPA: GNAT family N-acetyltransferase [Burkholderia cenocepacia]|uniref:GNAT family N-acetyltransferase n=1 Tax=unclassified Burkholderia TaxID=2613784 RepID=UPI00158B23FB|nr:MULTISPECIES: N-acetyltransferase [unclassified Burkholderia]HEF5875079.1 GNAT family N-acetyltransferase [Burkholderia cenocepacia]
MSDLVSAQPRHIDELVELICTTGPYRTAVANNLEGLDYRAFLARFLVEPRLGSSYVLLDSARGGKVIGALVCAPLTDYVPTDWSRCSRHGIDGLHAPFKHLQVPESFYIDTLAVASDMQGKGIGKRLFREAEAMASAAGYRDDLSLTVSASATGAIGFYHAMGLIVTDCVQMKLPAFPPFLLMRSASQFLSYERVCN